MKLYKITKIEIIGLFRYLNYSINLNESINIMHGINGIGKTTILYIITNILNGNLKPFYQLSFKQINLEFVDGMFFKMYRVQEQKANVIYFDFKIGNELFEKRDIRTTNSIDAFKRRLNISPLFLPAQRFDDLDRKYKPQLSYLEAVKSIIDSESFIPRNTMTLIESLPLQITEKARRLSIEINEYFLEIDNQLFELFFKNAFNQKSKSTKIDEIKIQEKIKNIKKEKDLYLNTYKKLYLESKILENIEEQIYSVNPIIGVETFLDLYLNNIRKKNEIIDNKISPFINFEKVINKLFKGKKIQIDINSKLNEIFKIVTDDDQLLKIEHLSLGEQNLLLIFYHYFFQIEDNTFFMIDEPELSLHIDWQEHIINYFIDYSKQNQIIVVTHSPDILQGHNEFEINLEKCRIN